MGNVLEILVIGISFSSIASHHFTSHEKFSLLIVGMQGLQTIFIKLLFSKHNVLVHMY